jgi:glutamate racemase
MDYLRRHPEMDERISRGGSMQFYTTDDAADFEEKATVFFGDAVAAAQVHL